MKHTYRTEEEKTLICHRLNRMEGQLRGIKKMVEEDRYCNDILIQLSAVENSVKSLSNHILEKHLYMCIQKDLGEEKEEVIEELASLFKRFNR